jgi:hypothetical protein
MKNSVVADFRKELPTVITREISRSVLKIYFQYKMQMNYGFIAGVAAGLYQAVTTAVDIRSWTALPENFQVAHMEIPSDGRVTVNPPEGQGIEINLPSDCKNVILYLRIVAPDVEPVYDFMKF